MTLRASAQLPPAARRVGGLLANARPLTSLEDYDGNSIGARWARGVVFAGYSCVEPALRGPCANQFTSGGDQVDQAQPPNGPWSFMPTTVRQGTRCTTLSMLNGQQMSERRLDATREWAAGHVLQTGEHTEHDDGEGGEQTNPALVDGTTIASGLPPVSALGVLEQAAANNLYGAPWVIHATPQIAANLLAASAIWRDGTRWRTASEAPVIVSPGYTGSDLYATSEVYAGAGEREFLADVDRTVNNADAWADELVLAVFDPCWVGVVGTDITAGGAGGVDGGSP